MRKSHYCFPDKRFGIMKRILIFSWILLFTSLFFQTKTWATHNRAGEITYKSDPLPDEPYRFVFNIYTYTKFGGASDQADRDTLDVDFGDNSPIGKAPRINGLGKGEIILNADNVQIKYNHYQITHTYNAAFTYVVSMQDPNRIEGIKNISNSVNMEFYLQDTIFIRDPQFFGYNNSPVLYQPPIDFANKGYPFIHNPNAYDEDGDSLHFSLITPYRDRNAPVPYFSPTIYNEGGNPADNNLSIDAATGELIWDSPQEPGIYNIAILIREYRNGLQIGNMIRDMQIIVKDVNNEPPEIAEINDTCIIISDKFELDVEASDPDAGQKVTLSAWGAPFEVQVSPATFSSFPDNPVSGKLTWQTTCNHISSLPYTIVIKAEDNFEYKGSFLPLADLETWRLKLIAPPPEGLQATVVEKNIQLTWNQPYICADTDKFRGFALWRKVGCDNVEPDKCETNLEAFGYVKIADRIKEYQYLDQNAIKGFTYSYRINAEFADAYTDSNPPAPINLSYSMPSKEACIELPKDAPVITHVDVQTTDINAGEIFIAWSKPKPNDLDTAYNTPPYIYEIMRSESADFANAQSVHQYTANSFALANDTIFVDTGLNTKDKQYWYRIRFFTTTNNNGQSELLDETEIASSVFLNLVPGDNAMTLSLDVDVPWLNTEYHIYRTKDMINGVYDSIAYSTQTTFIDTELQNGKEYCYYIKAIGTYASNGIVDPLINRSQKNCAIPIDTIKPCPPNLEVFNYCNDEELVITDEGILNQLEWHYTEEQTCAEDVIKFNIYFAISSEESFEKIAEINDPSINIYQHLLQNSLVGCYAITAVDSFNNESIYSNIVCMENCIEYELPNTFTPNDDSANDLFVPRASRFVNRVDMKIYNRWGNLVFETTDPQINWNGTDGQTGAVLSEGTYYYVCDVYEDTGIGESKSQLLSGYIHLIRGK